MIDVCFIGHFTEAVKTHLRTLFNKIGLKVTFSDSGNIEAKARIFESSLIRSTGDFASIHGYAYLHTNSANIRYPWPVELFDECENKNGKTNALKHFGLIAIHEFLHLKGVGHCSTPGCLMAKTSCTQGEGTGYCLGCLSARTEELPLCSECTKQLEKLR